MAITVTLNEWQIKALTECLGEAIAGLGLADDADEIVGCRIEDTASGGLTIEESREWARQWDFAIQFHNENVDNEDAKYSKPWVVKELESQLEL